MFWKHRAAKPSGPIDFVVAGLGNPGQKYEDTRHNVGFWAVDHLAEVLGVKLTRIQYKSLTGEGRIGEKRILMLKPSTYMNLSGQAVQEALSFYKLSPDRLLVILDDVSLPPGRMRIRRKGSDGGHNGIKNIIYLLGSDEFPRIRLGVGQKPSPEWDLAGWVLGRFSREEGKLVQEAISKVPQAVEWIVKGEIDKAMDACNG